jgi:hypothetical protein
VGGSPLFTICLKDMFSHFRRSRRVGWVTKIGYRFAYLHTPSKNPPPVSWRQAYIACILG